MKLDVQKYQETKVGLEKARFESNAVMIRKGGTIEYKFRTDPGTHPVVMKVRTGQGQTLTKSDLFDGYKISIDGTVQKMNLGDIGEMEARFGKSYWGFIVSPGVQFAKGEHTITIEAIKDWLGIESIEIVGARPESTSIPVEDFKDRYLAEKARADETEVNLSKAKSDLVLSKKEYEELAREVIKLRQKVELADDLVALALPNKEQFLTHVQKSVEIIDKYKGL